MSILAASLLVLASGGASAGTEQPATAKPAESKDKGDPVICESSTEIGSRLKRRKVCMHRSEWQRQHQEDKQIIDRTQVLRGLDPGG